MASPRRKAFFATFALPAAHLGPVLRRAFRRFELARAVRITVRLARKWTNRHALPKLRLQLTHSLGRTVPVRSISRKAAFLRCPARKIIKSILSITSSLPARIYAKMASRSSPAFSKSLSTSATAAGVRLAQPLARSRSFRGPREHKWSNHSDNAIRCSRRKQFGFVST
jgi:hypothetical protein